MTDELLPRSVLSSPETVRARVALIVAVAMAGAALAGIWLRFEDGMMLRLVMATTSAIFAAIVTVVALSAQNTWGAIGRAIGCSTVFGVVSTILPSAIIASQDSISFFPCLVAGAFFGAFTGFAYGLVLAAACGLAWKHVASRTHEGADQAIRIAALWSLFPGLLSTWVATGYDAQRHLSEWASDADRAAHTVAVPLGVIGASLTLTVAVAALFSATRRMRRRRDWLTSIVLGPDSEWNLRDPGPHDDLTRLPRLRPGALVLAHRTATSAAYRTNATSHPVAII